MNKSKFFSKGLSTIEEYICDFKLTDKNLIMIDLSFSDNKKLRGHYYAAFTYSLHKSMK